MYRIRIITLLLLSVFSLWEGAAVAMPQYNGGLPGPDQFLNDTIDEEGLQAMRDTTQMSRRNLAKDSKTINLQDYILNDTYSPTHHSFTKAWYEHLYVGGSLGIEQIVPQVDDYSYRFFSNVSLYLGKQINRTNSVRLGIGYGWGYEKTDNAYLNRVSAKLDYLYNLSTHFQGYNPARPMEISLLAGVGMNYSHLSSQSKTFSPEAHIGLQLKCYTGPLGTINIEPYVGIASDKIDISEKRNWRGYDAFYGINLNYSFFLDDNLSDEARQKILQSRLADDRMINAYTMEKWRTPWFVEYSMGMAMTSSDYLDFSKTIGNQTSVAVGRWLSPVIGYRLMLNSRTTRWLENASANNDNVIARYNNFYVNLNLEALVNPFGFFKNFKWSNPYGAYLTFGYGMGLLRKYNPNGVRNVRSEAYNIGLHLWGNVTDNMQVFIEPRFGRNIYNGQDATGRGATSFMGDNTFSINAGITMLIRSEKYKNPSEMDATQNYTYRHIKGFRAGVDFGPLILQKQYAYFKTDGMSLSLRPYMEYRFNHLHSVRATGDFIRLNKTLSQNGSELLTSNSTHVITSLDYEISLTNLLAGRLVNRRIEVEGFIGPSVAFTLKKDKTATKGSSSATELGYMGKSESNKNIYAGANAGLKISYHIWNGIYATLTPTIYVLSNFPAYSGFSTIGVSRLHFVQTLNLGVQYKIGRLSRNKEVQRRHQREKDAKWKARQIEKIEKAEAKQEAKRAKRKH